MGLSDVKIMKGNGGLGRRNPSDDGVTGFITTGVAVSGKLALGTTYKLNSIDDALALGVDAAYDSVNELLVYMHLAELFRINPDATVYLLVASMATTMADLVDPEKTLGPQLLRDADYRMVQLAVGWNIPDGFDEVNYEGFDEVVHNAVDKAQLLADYADSIHAPLSAIGIEGLKISGTPSAMIDLHSKGCNKVSVIIAQDKSITGLTGMRQYHAAIGSWAGCQSLAKVHENIGWPEKFGLTDTKNKKWLQAGLSNGTALSAYTPEQLDLLDDKGLVFARTIAQLPGVYLNDSYTCTTLSDDYCRSERNRVMDKAIKLIRKALLPKLNSPLAVDEETGYLQPYVVADFETLAQRSLDTMLLDGEISGGSVRIDPQQNVLATDEIVVDAEVIPLGLAHGILLKVGFNNPFKTV